MHLILFFLVVNHEGRLNIEIDLCFPQEIFSYVKSPKRLLV